ncbi:phosphatase PAP2 family protein [Noviherbaspirillum galbum]|uniref:Phosphatase PAP2 family protein n=1 Tax=Noviherbaspirillum galbum TaxID=2709383 RepID=A0A6B3STP6_9BURK|nr:phosphatase PAP2 family protein [Noviherbaspirillum galbum]NEX64054.1 phosphatase PAP2 family protein [Noviherbaspirillum galbum]
MPPITVSQNTISPGAASGEQPDGLPDLPLAPASGERSRWRDAMRRLDAREMRTVERWRAAADGGVVRQLTAGVNLLGNGWIYLPIAIALMVSSLAHAWWVLGTALLATAIAHLLYGRLKRRVRRLRPFERNTGLAPISRVLDRYSFPSGHCMTLTAVLTPIVVSAPACWPAAACALAVLSWCRIAAAHHYPSDVLAGVLLGASIAYPLARLMLPA